MTLDKQSYEHFQLTTKSLHLIWRVELVVNNSEFKLQLERKGRFEMNIAIWYCPKFLDTPLA